jgi:hypothetical protein
MKKMLIIASAVSMFAVSAAYAEWEAGDVTGEPEVSLPGGENAGGNADRGWSYAETTDADWDHSEMPENPEHGDEYTATREHQAVNPGGNTPGTDRWNYTESQTFTWNEPVQEEMAGNNGQGWGVGGTPPGKGKGK